MNTGSNATIAISSDDFSNITFNNSTIPHGALIGVFYVDNNGDYVCGGYNTWDSSGTISVTAWGTEAGLDNGFAIGESYTWFLQINGEDYSADSNGATMSTTPPFSNTYSLNGFGQLTAVNFVGSIQGCTDPLACNYDSSATVDDGSCYYNPGCTDSAAFNYDSTYDYDDGSCAYSPGCTNTGAYNYDSTADIDNGTCCYIAGCTDSTAFNYNSNACYDDGSCIAVALGCTDSSALNYDVSANTNDDTCCYIGGCMDSTAFNYDEDACYDDGSCIAVVEGCTDSSMFNYDSTANTDDGSCIPFIFGCMDTIASVSYTHLTLPTKA